MVGKEVLNQFTGIRVTSVSQTNRNEALKIVAVYPPAAGGAFVPLLSVRPSCSVLSAG